MKNTEESPIATGRMTVETSLFSVFLWANALRYEKKASTMTNLAFAVDLLFLSHVEILFQLHFEFLADAFTSSCSALM